MAIEHKRRRKNIFENQAALRSEVDTKKILSQLKERILGRNPNWHESIWP